MQVRESNHSNHLPRLVFRDNEKVYEILRKSPFYAKIYEFFDHRDISSYSEVEPEYGVSPSEFSSPEKVSTSHIYNRIFGDVTKENGRVCPVSYIVTFDERVFGIDSDNNDTKICNETDLKYEFITLGGSPVLFYFHLDPQKVINLSRKNH